MLDASEPNRMINRYNSSTQEPMDLLTEVDPSIVGVTINMDLLTEVAALRCGGQNIFTPSEGVGIKSNGSGARRP